MNKKWVFLPVLLLFLILGFQVQTVQAKVDSEELILERDEKTGDFIYAFKYTVDGKVAICIEGTVIAPTIGHVTSEWQEIYNDDLRKVLYYGNGGPCDKGYTFVETVFAAQEANGDGNSELGVKILAEIVKLELPPSNFRIWKVETNKGRYQDLAIYTTGTDGYLELKKESANEELTQGNETYSLAGAVYGVYKDATCTVKVGELVTDEAGKSGQLLLTEGTYYVKELVAPPGYELDTESHMVNVLVERTVVLELEDNPIQNTYVLPETGSSLSAWIELIGIEMMILSKKKRRR